MPRHKAGMEIQQALRPWRKGTKSRERKYAVGWTPVPGEPREAMLRIAGSVHSEVFVGVETHSVYKVIKLSGEWFVFYFLPVEGR